MRHYLLRRNLVDSTHRDSQRAYGTNRTTGRTLHAQAESRSMPHPTPLRSGDPKRVGQYRLTGRLEGIPSDDPIFTGVGQDDTHVSITVLSGDWALDAAARDRFAAEAAVARRVPPFCAARVLDAGLDGSLAYLVGEYIQGPSLLE